MRKVSSGMVSKAAVRQLFLIRICHTHVVMERLRMTWDGEGTEGMLDLVSALANTAGGILVVEGYPPSRADELSGPLSFMGDRVRVSPDGGGVSLIVSRSDYPVRRHGHYLSIFGGRVFDATVQIESDLRRRAEKVYWLDRPYPEVRIDDLDWHAIEYFRELAGDDSQDPSDAGLLDSMGLLDEGTPTGTAVLLFHPCPESVLTGSFTRMS